jgi:hypothetical protein
MGSRFHPKLYDARTVAIIKAAFHDIWDEIEAYETLRISGSDTEIKANIIQRLLDLVAEGETRREHLTARVLGRLPIG